LRAAEADARHLREAARNFFPGQHVVSVIERSSGFSGSAFARVEYSGRSWCLRHWPPDFGEERLRFVHRVLVAGRAAGFSGLPDLAKTGDGETVLAFADGPYDAQEWLAGEPLSGATVMDSGGPTPNVVAAVPRARIASLAASLARFHLSTAHLSPGPADPTSPLPARLARLAEVAEARHEPLLSAVQARAEGEERLVASRWLKLLRGAAELASEARETFPEEPGRRFAVCHGDLWPAHVHFDGDAFVGFTDFESLSFASPALDLAQLALHFGGWEIREDVLRGYESVAPLDERDRSLLPIEAVIDLAGEGYWALEALYGTTSSRTTPEQRTAHLLNLRELMVSMDLAATEIGLGR
jgi:aminoglycoside phosphotransferase (APT) family kinase protein